MAIDFGKYGTVAGVEPTEKPLDFSRYGTIIKSNQPVDTGLTKYAVEETRKDKIQRFQEEAKIAVEEADTANSVIEKYIKPIAQAVLPGTSELGETLSGIFLTGNAAKDYEIINENLTEANVSLAKTIREREKKGQNVDDLKRSYNKNVDAIEQAKKQFEKTIPQKTTAQVGGELAMTALNVLTAGTYGKATQGMKTFALGKSVLPDVLTKTISTVAKPSGILTKQGLGRVSLGAGIGEAYDITQNLQDGLTGPEVLTEGYAKYFGAGLPLVSGLGASAYSKLSPKNTREQLGNVYREVFSKYSRPNAVLEIAERTHKTDPISVLQMYGKETLPEMFNGGASTAEARDFLRNKIKELSELRNEDLFLNDTRIPLSDYRQYANDLIDTQNWSASKKNKVRGDVNKIIDSLEQSYTGSPKNVNGLELNEINLIKSEETNKSKSYNNPNSPFDYDAHAITGKAARDLVELFSESQATKDLNKLIQGHYDAIDLMESLEGKKVQGGMLSRQFSRLTGTLIGMSLDGSTTGGIAGNVIAGKIAEIIQNQFITNPIKRMLINNLKEQSPKEVEAVLKSIQQRYGEAFQDLFPQKNTSINMNTTNANTTNPISGMITRGIEKVKDTPNKEGGFIKNPLAEVDNLQPLAQEARKYKSAEEFVRKAEIEVPIKDILPTEGHTPEVMRGKLPAKGYEKQPIRVEINKDGKLQIQDGNRRYYQALERGDKTIKIRFNDDAPSLNFDGEFDRLTDIWNKANKKGIFDLPNKQGGFATLPYKEEGELTTKILKDLEGKTTVSKQYILDATNRGELKQAERDITREVLNTIKGDTVNVKEFADKVKQELLPLKRKDIGFATKPGVDGKTRYESITLPGEQRGNVSDYKEHVYNSPIKTSAGDTHFSHLGKDKEGYFGHTRIEDMADNKTRRVIEVQSDLYQKGNLEKEMTPYGYDFTRQKYEAVMTPEDIKAYRNAYEENTASAYGVGTKESVTKARDVIDTLEAKYRPALLEAKQKPLQKLQQYNDPTAHFRMIREEIRKAAQDGKTKLQFPTGETAMKIEGLGSQSDWVAVDFSQYNTPQRIVNRTILTPETLKVGMDIQQGGITGGGQRWIITDILGDGKFKAVPKDKISEASRNMLAKGKDRFDISSTDSLYISNYSETFDISGKVDTNNPIYKFYEKDVQKYLKKYDGKLVTDDKGVTWIEVPIKKEYGTQPVEAFGKIKSGALLPIAGGTAGALVGADLLIED